MKRKLFGFLKTNRQGIALISVLGVVTLATILILALFSVSDAEFKASKVYADGNQARQLADIAVNLVTAQIQSAATGAGTGMSRTIWASQPGAVRVYAPGGNFIRGRKLYSSDNMVETTPGLAGEIRMANDVPAEKWNEQPAEWTDLNQSVTRVTSDSAGATATVNLFPIVDPMAAATVGAIGPAIEGFSYSSSTATGSRINGVRSVGDANPALPMPVRWLYVLKDGNVGTVTQASGSDTATWVTAGSVAPTADNPIIGRVAFWTDDESCKININTAGEPSYYGLPTVFSNRDSNWGNNPPATFEYQRFPGHPATVALSSVLYPNPTGASTTYNGDSYPNYPQTYIDLKNAIYNLSPKLGIGGSQDGTLAFDVDDFSSKATANYAALSASRLSSAYEHLYTSVDELIFDKVRIQNGLREKVAITYGAGAELVTPEKIARARAFLTASSRASELNMFGLPRVAIWPIPDESLGEKFRTGYDSTIAATAALGRPPVGTSTLVYHPNSYIFRRRDSQSAIVDIGASGSSSAGLQRNAELMNYLDQMMNAIMPGGTSFRQKYGVQDSRQILVEIFDYIRCTNLYDAYLDENYVNERGGRDYLDDGSSGNGPFAPGAKVYTGSDLARATKLWNEAPAQFKYYTYTAPRFDTVRRVGDLEPAPPDGAKRKFNKGEQYERVAVGAYPGHGQVRPIEWAVGGQTYKGFGRFPTISEVALHFICTGDGYTGTDAQPDPGAYVITKNNQKIRSGGKTAQRVDASQTWDNGGNRKPLFKVVRGQNVPTYWYSNIPPFPSRAQFEAWGCNFATTNAADPAYPPNHPAWDPQNWNCTLDSDPVTGGIPLKEDEKRVQAAIQIEMFVPSVGYTKYVPDFTIVLNGSQLSALQVQNGNGVWLPLFPTTGSLVVQSTAAYWGSLMGEGGGSTNVSPMGGSYGSQPLMSGRQAAATAARMPKDPNYNDQATSDIHSGMLNFPLISSPFTVKRGANARIKFRVEGANGGIQADIYASHDWQGSKDTKHKTPVQSIILKIPGAAGSGEEEGVHSTPVPRLVVQSTDRRQYILNGTQRDTEAIHACRWWAFNSSGAVGRYTGSPSLQGGGPLGINYNAVIAKDGTSAGQLFSDANDVRTGTFGRFKGQSRESEVVFDEGDSTARTVPISTRIYGYSPSGPYTGVKSKEEDLPNEDVVNSNQGKMANYGYWGSDSVRSIIPRHGDYRILAARKIVPADIWQLHPVWQVNPEALFAHSLTGFRSDSEAGFDVGVNRATSKTDPKLRMVEAWYPTHQVPDTPLTAAAANESTLRRDFDNGPGNFRDGAYINKADDGNLSVAQFWYATAQEFYQTRNAYFIDSFLQMPSKNAFFTPNRMLTGPGMFGSLSTGVYGSVVPNSVNAIDRAPPDPEVNGIPWRTLLFRPDVNDHPGALAPADHNILDLFWMPVVEPYAISDSYSTAGKINLNFQMLPFTHINRSTGIYAALKGELITTISAGNGDTLTGGTPSATNYVAYKTFKNSNAVPKQYWSEEDKKYWHRKINIAETVRHMSGRMNTTSGQNSQQGLFRTASQICEVHLIPDASRGAEPNLLNLGSALKNTMNTFWNVNKLTGDNMRERPYTNIYQKVTTRSNTYRVHFIAQTIKKARSVAANQVDVAKDSITAEYRGSSLLERFLDFNKSYTEFPNYGSMASPFNEPSLESRYRYRVLETKQFLP